MEKLAEKMRLLTCFNLIKYFFLLNSLPVLFFGQLIKLQANIIAK